MKSFAIDTNRYEDVVKGEIRASELFRDADQIFVPFVVLGELRYGFHHGAKRKSNELRLQNFLRMPYVFELWPNGDTTDIYGQLSAQLRRQGAMIPTNDIWIAALVVQHQLPLFARDAHFDRLPQVQRI